MGRWESCFVFDSDSPDFDCRTMLSYRGVLLVLLGICIGFIMFGEFPKGAEKKKAEQRFVDTNLCR